VGIEQLNNHGAWVKYTRHSVPHNPYCKPIRVLFYDDDITCLSSSAIPSCTKGTTLLFYAKLWLLMTIIEAIWRGIFYFILCLFLPRHVGKYRTGSSSKSILGADLFSHKRKELKPDANQRMRLKISHKEP
jgi:hypothetical protein